METDVILRPSTRATVRYVGRSPYKVRQVVNLIRGKQAEEALNILLLCDRGAAEEVSKLLNSAIANAEHNNHIPAEELKITEAFVDEGPTAKRFRPRARGRGNRILKRSSHITIVVSRMEAEEIKVKAQKDSDSGAANAREQRRRRTEASKAAAKAKQEELDGEIDESALLENEEVVSDKPAPKAKAKTAYEEKVSTKEAASSEKKTTAKKASPKKAVKDTSEEASGASEETTGSESPEGREAATDGEASKAKKAEAKKTKKSTKDEKEGDA